MLPAAARGAVASRLAGRAAARLGRHRVITALAAAPIAGLLVAAAGAPVPSRWSPASPWPPSASPPGRPC